MPISDADLWHQVHAQREDGVAAMFLIRDVEPRPDQPQIVVVQLPYEVTDLSRLPDATAYHRFDNFQEEWIEPACEALGWTLVASKSEDGSFYVYLYGDGDPSALVDRLTPFDQALQFYNHRDAEWSEYASLRELVEQAEAADQEESDGVPHIHTDECDHDHDDDHDDDHDHDDHDHQHNGQSLDASASADESESESESESDESVDSDAVREPVVTRPGRSTRAATVGERPSNVSRPAREAVVREPAANQSAAKKPAAKAAAKKPAAKAAAKKPAAQPAARKPAAKAAARKPAAKAAAKKPAAKKPAAKATQKPAAKKSAAKATQKPAAKKPAVKTAGRKPAAKAKKPARAR